MDGVDFNIKFFNTFHYTIYVPTNDAIQQAINDGIINDWDAINLMTNAIAKEEAISKLGRFLRYHFQDNSVLISGTNVEELYPTAALKTNDLASNFNTFKNKYYKLKVTSDGSNISLETEKGGTANVIKTNGLFNIIARDYIFNNSPATFNDINVVGSSDKDYSSSRIETSSTAVIHQIDNVLRFE